MNEQLRAALNTIIDIQDVSGLNRKKELLSWQKDNETLKDILYFVFNPYIRTGIGWTKLKKIKNPEYINIEPGHTIQGMFTYLLHNNTGRDKDIMYVWNYIDAMTKGEIQKERFAEILGSIFTKNLKLGISTTTIHKVWPDLIPGFGVQLACKWQDNLEYLRGKEIFITEKLDGNRCFANVKDHKVTFYSRSGREIEGLDDVGSELSRLIDGWYDGELIASTFNETQQIVRKKGTKGNLVFNIFDYVTDKEVQAQQGIYNYLGRRNELERIFKGIEKFQNVKLVPLIGRGTFDEDWVIKTLDQYTSQGSEGIMLNLNMPYQFNRTADLLKVKKMYTLDLEIIGMSEGNGEFSNSCGALIVNYKGFPVGVGSGISKEERFMFWNNKDKYIGRVIEVQAFEESTDQNGNLSLRFPVYKGLRPLGKEVSYD